jgi:hypothetical protein
MPLGTDHVLRPRTGRAIATSRRNVLTGCGAVVATAAVLAAPYAWKQDAKPVPPRSVTVLIDVTDPLFPGQHQALSTALMAVIDRLATGDMISLSLIVPSEQGPLKPLVAQSKPKHPHLANILFESSRLLKMDYEAFEGEFRRVLQAIAEIKTGALTSPIVEALWTQAQKGPLDELVLWTDLVAASSTVNHFRPGYKFDDAMRHKLALTGLANLRGTKVSIYQLAVNTQHQTVDLKKWWLAYWQYVGAEIVAWSLVPA